MTKEGEPDDFTRWVPTPDEKREEFSAGLKYLGLNVTAFADRLGLLGDKRDSTRVDEIQAFHSGKNEAPEELLVIVELLKRQRRRITRTYAHLNWYRSKEDRIVRAHVDDFAIRLVPETRGRYWIQLEHSSGYSPKWPKWTKPLAEAKIVAIQLLDDSLSYIDDNPDQFIRQVYETQSAHD
jgi:hypothetical protein